MQLILGKVKSHPFSLLVFIAPISVLGCLGAGPRLSLSPFWVILGWFLFSFSPKIGQSNTNFCQVLQCRCRFRNRHQKLCVAAKFFATADSKISSKTFWVPNQKSVAKLCHYRFRNRHPKTIFLPIQKSATMVDSFWLYLFFRCLHGLLLRFLSGITATNDARIHQRTQPLPIQDLTEKTASLPIQESAAMVGSFFFLSFFCWVFTLHLSLERTGQID